MGDSLSAAYGIDEKKGWVTLLGEYLEQHAYEYKIVNLSVSGYTTSNGVSRLSEGLATYKPEVVIIELGANDGLRGLSLKEMRRNLEQMIIQSHQKSAKVLLLATLLPSNYGQQYLTRFNQVYTDLATKYQVQLVPMFLQGIAGVPSLMQADSLHPNQQAQEKILDNIWPVLKTLL